MHNRAAFTCGRPVYNLWQILWGISPTSTHPTPHAFFPAYKPSPLYSFIPHFYSHVRRSYAQLFLSAQSVKWVVLHSIHRAYINLKQDKERKTINS